MQYIKLDHAESCGGQTEDEESSRYLSHACVCAARGRVIALSVCQSVSGHINEHIEQIRNACSFFLQCISNKWKNNLNTPHKQESYDELSKLLNKSHLDFNIPTIIYRSTFIPNKAQPASSVSANSTSNGISALLGTSWVLYTNYHSSQYNYVATIQYYRPQELTLCLKCLARVASCVRFSWRGGQPRSQRRPAWTSLFRVTPSCTLQDREIHVSYFTTCGTNTVRSVRLGGLRMKLCSCKPLLHSTEDDRWIVVETIDFLARVCTNRVSSCGANMLTILRLVDKWY